jgi:hypothetical protein
MLPKTSSSRSVPLLHAHALMKIKQRTTQKIGRHLRAAIHAARHSPWYLTPKVYQWFPYYGAN